MKKKMMLGLIALAVFISAGAQFSKEKGSGKITKVNVTVENFTGIAVNGSFEVIVSPGQTPSVVVETDDNIQPLLDIKVKKGLLVVGYKSMKNISPSKRTKVFIINPVLNKATISGSGTLKTTAPLNSSESFEATISGSGNIIAQVTAPETNAAISGSGNIELSGSTKKLDVKISGSGNFKGYNYKVQDAIIKIAGSGNVQTNSTGKIDASISGSGDVLYKGQADISVKAAGSGKIKKVD